MGKTFLVGFVGLFLVGGFVTGLYLINQKTNPSSSASSGEEMINPIPPPQQPTSNPAPVFAVCEKLFGFKKGDVKYDVKCDVDNDGAITILDLQKLK